MANNDEFTSHLNLQWKKCIAVRNRYKETYLKWKDNRFASLCHIHLIMDAMLRRRHHCNIAGLTSGCAGAVGGILTVVGLVTLPFSLGATAPIFLAGTCFLVGAGGTGLGTALVDLVLSKESCAQAQRRIDRDKEFTIELQIVEKEYAQNLESMDITLRDLETNHPREFIQWRETVTSALGGAFRSGSCLYKLVGLARTVDLIRLGRLTLTSSRMLNHINPIPFLKIDDVIAAGGQASIAAGKGLQIFAAASALCVFGLAIDITSIVYNSRLVHVHRMKGKGKYDTLSSGQEKETATGGQTEECADAPHENLINSEMENYENDSTVGAGGRDPLPTTKFQKFKSKFRPKQRIKHHFTKTYTCERAEQLRLYVNRLESEMFAMESNDTIKELMNECPCRECTPVGGGLSVHCCHQNMLYWNSVRIDQPLITHNTPCLCVTQHPQFAQIYLNEENLEKHFPHLRRNKKQNESKFIRPRYRLLRFAAYSLFVRNSRQQGTNVRVPDCVRRAVVQTFQSDTDDVWMRKDGLGIQNMWNIDLNSLWAWIPGFRNNSSSSNNSRNNSTSNDNNNGNNNITIWHLQTDSCDSERLQNNSSNSSSNSISSNNNSTTWYLQTDSSDSESTA